MRQIIPIFAQIRPGPSRRNLGPLFGEMRLLAGDSMRSVSTPRARLEVRRMPKNMPPIPGEKSASAYRKRLGHWRVRTNEFSARGQPLAAGRLEKGSGDRESMESLTVSELGRLETLEHVIERGLTTFYE